jgi:hypothetical protein
MSQVIEQPRNDVPIVTDATLLAVPPMNDENGRAEYIAKIRALRNAPAKAEPQPQPQPKAEVVQPEPVDTPAEPELSADAIDEPSEVVDTASSRTRLSPEDLAEYEIPVTDEDGNTQYLSYDEFQKTVGLYSKQNKRARELAEREREVEALKTNLISQNAAVIDQTTAQEAQMTERYQWVQNSIAFAHQHGVDVINFEDGTSKKLTALIAEKTALENAYNGLQAKKTQAQRQLEAAQQDFIKAQDEVLEKRAPNIKKSRADIAKFLEREGFTQAEANALAHAKAELLVVIDKAMRYDNAQNSQPKERKVSSNTKVLKQPSRLAGRGTPVNSQSNTRMQELQALGNRAKPDELRELRRLQLQNR